MTVPAVRDALRDLALGRLGVAVLDVLHERLDFVDFYPVKLAELELVLHRPPSSLSPALRQLTARGYIEKGARAWPGGPYLYRLRYSRTRALSSSSSVVVPR